MSAMIESDPRASFAMYQVALADEPWRFDFFQVLRRFEHAHPDVPRLGRASRPSEEPIRLGQDPYMHFAPAAVQSFRPAEGHRLPRLSVYFFGVFGPQAPLPIHITEYARQRMHNYGDRSLVRFVDMFHHRMTLQFYRAWADAEPAVSHDRFEEDRIASYVGALTGLGQRALEGRDAMPDLAKLFFAGHLAGSCRHPEGLASMLSCILSVPAHVEEFVTTWAPLPEDAQWNLSSRSPNRLGLDTVIGAFARQVQQRFRVVLGPLEPNQFDDLLPGQPGLRTLAAVVRNYLGDELEWELALIRSRLEPMQLGGTARLGWTSGLAGKSPSPDGIRVVIRP